jgi:hypothetical protein
LALAIPGEECVSTDGTDKTKERTANNCVREIAGSTRERKLNKQCDEDT